MIKKIIFILCFNILISSEIIERTQSLIFNIFPENKNINHSIYHIEESDIKEIQNKVRQIFFRKELNIWTIQNSDSSNYFAILDNVKGKSLPITFLAIYDNNGEVYHTEIIKYREAYGGEVRSRNWLNQFLNYNNNSDYKVGDAIDGISGATISVKSISKGMHKLSLLVQKLIKETSE